jgi:hypothetical protein
LPLSTQALGHSFWAKTSYLIEIGLVAKQLVEQHAQEPRLQRGLPSIAAAGTHKGSRQQGCLVRRAVDQKHSFIATNTLHSGQLRRSMPVPKQPS